MTREEFKARVSMALSDMNRETWEEFLESVWQLHLEASNQWIPVEERLPEVDDCGNSDFYLVHDFGESDHVAYYCKTDNEWNTENGELVFSTHWMPIVPPRKED